MAATARKRSRSGDGSVFRRADGKWIAQISSGERGARRQQQRVRATHAAALDALRELRGADTTVRKGDPAPRLDDFLAAWLEGVQRRRRDQTYRQYRSIIGTHIVPQLGEMQIDRIRPADVVRALAAIERGNPRATPPRRPATARTREMFVILLRSALETAVGTHLAANPVQRAHRPRVPRRTMVVWTADQTRAFLDATAHDPLATLYRLALSTGMRRGELLGLQWADVDLKRGRLQIQHTLSDQSVLGEPKTASSRRRIELTRRTVEALAEQLERQRAAGLKRCPWVFADDRGNVIAPRSFNASFDRAIAAFNESHEPGEALPRIRVHDMRHTAATLLLGLGAHPKIVSELLGHASITITLGTYSHALPSMQRETVDRLNDVI